MIQQMDVAAAAARVGGVNATTRRTTLPFVHDLAHDGEQTYGQESKSSTESDEGA
jgi:hypothetical protein